MAINIGARPNTLDGCWQSWKEQDIDTIVRTDMESGQIKTRRRFTGTARIVQASVTLPKALYNDFMTWWRVNQRQGAIGTRVKTPAGTEEVFQWVKPPSISWVGDGGAFKASVEMYQGSWF